MSNRGWEGDGRRWLFFGNVEFPAGTDHTSALKPFRGLSTPDAHKAILATILRNHKTGADALAHLQSLLVEKTSPQKDTVPLDDKLVEKLNKLMKKAKAWSSFSPYHGSFETIATNDGKLTGNVALFEIFRDRNDPVWHTHPSRNRFYAVRGHSEFREGLFRLANAQVQHDRPLHKPEHVRPRPNDGNQRRPRP